MENESRALPTAPREARTGRIVLGVAALLIILFVVGIVPRLHRQSGLDAAVAAEKAAPRDVNVGKPLVVAAESGESLLPGTIQAVSQTAIGARTSGYIRKLYVDIGSTVHAGQTLAEIESPEIDQQLVQATADAAKSEASVRQSQADVARIRAGVTQQEAEVSRLHANVAGAQAQLARSQSALAQAKSASSGAEAKVAQSKQALAQRQADLKQVQADYGIADKTYTRWQQLAKDGAVSQQTADEKEAIREGATAKVSAATAAVEAANADVRAAEEALNASHSQIAAAASDRDSAIQTIAAAKAAVRSGQANVIAAQASVSAGQSNVEAARAGAGSSQANVQRYAVLRGFETVKAPFDGIITARNVDEGALVNSAGTTGTTDPSGTSTPRSGLFGIARTNQLRIQISVPQALLGSVRTGEKATVFIRELPGRKFVGTIHQKSGALDASTRTLLTEVWLANPGSELLPGMYAQVQLGGPEKGAVALPHIPSAALIADMQGTRVATVSADKKVHFVPVKVSRDFGADLEIAEGIQGNETLVLNPSDDLTEGEAVHPVESKPEKPAAK